MKIWVDDIRPAPQDWAWLFTSEQAIIVLSACKERGVDVVEMSLDHDLGGEDTSRAIVLWMCENDFWPEKVVVHSMNPVGAEWLESMIERYHPNTRSKYVR